MAPQAPSVLLTSLRRWLLAVIGLTATLAVAIVAFYVQDRDHERELVRQQTADSLVLASDKIERELESVKSDVLYLSRQSSLQRYFNGIPDARDELQREYLTFAEEKAIYDQIRLLNLEGEEIIRINYQSGTPVVVSESELQPKSSRYYFHQAVNLPRGEVFVSPMDLNEERGEIQVPYMPVIRFVTPVFDSAGDKQGFLVMNFLGHNILTEFDETMRDVPGTQYVANSRGHFLSSPNPADNWGWLLGHSHSLKERFAEFWPFSGVLPGQTAGENGVFSAFKLRFSENDALLEKNASDELHGGDASLLLVSFVSWREIDLRSEVLLQRLVAISVGAILLFAIVAGYWAHASAVRQQQRQLLALSESRLRVLSRQLLLAQEEERRRISRDLHDDLSQQITAISLNLQSAQRQKSVEEANQLLGKGIDGAQRLLASVHHIAGKLRPSVLDDLTFEAAIESLVSELESIYSIEIDCTLIAIEDTYLSGDIKENAYRIVQEALSNAGKHARHSAITLRLEIADGKLHIVISDDGKGFVTEETDSTRLGLLGMRERAELLGGNLQVQSQTGAGTTIRVEIPTEQPPE